MFMETMFLGFVFDIGIHRQKISGIKKYKIPQHKLF